MNIASIFAFRRTSSRGAAGVLLAAVLALAVPVLLWSSPAAAYESYTTATDDLTTNCAQCHGGFRVNPYVSPKGENWGDDLHDIHRNTMLSGDCNTCHSLAGRDPVFLNSSAGGTGFPAISCVGCHGRAEDATATSDSGAGLRQHHWNAGETICADCHDDSNPANYTPVAENVLPPYYFTPDTAHPNKPTDPCNPAGEENFSPTILTGLDNDGNGIYDTADASCAVNTPPVAVDDSFTTDEDVQLIVAAPGVLANDTDADAGDTLTAVLNTGPTSGTLTLNADGSFSYMPNANFNGSDSFTYFANDGTVNSAAPATVTITVNPVNDAPVADAGGPYSGTAGIAVTFDGSGSSDPDGDTLTYAWDFGDTNTGTGVSPSHTYAAAGTFTVTLTVSDGALSDTATATATIAAGVADIAVSPLSVDFGTVTIGDSADRSVTILNAGTAVLNVTALNLMGSPTFAILSAPGLPGPIGPGNSVDVVLRYTPDMPAPPPDTGMLDILSDDPDEGLVTVTLSGQGQEAMMAGEILYADNCAECHGDPFDDVDVGIRKVPGSRECSIVAAIYGNPGAEDEEDSPFPDGVPDMQFLQGALSDEEIMQIADYLNSQPVSGQKRYVTACAGCHGIDASGGFVDEDVRGEDAEETKEAIWDEDAMRFLKCLPHSDIMQIGKYLEMLDDDDDDDHDDDDKDDDDRYAYKDD